MGKTIGLTTYSICVRDVASKQYELHDIYGWSLIEYLETIGNEEINKYVDDPIKENLFSINKVKVKHIVDNEKPQYDIIHFRIKTGDYGEESEIVEKTSGTVTHVKGDSEADVMPFVFSVAVPCGSYSVGVILLQSYGRNGIVSIVKGKLNEYIKKIDENLRIVMQPILPKHFINQYINNGVLKSIRLIRYDIPEEITEALKINAGVDRTVEERIFRNPVGFIANKKDDLIKVISGEKTYDEVIEIQDYEFDDLKLEFKMGRRNKIISMKNIDALVINEDITENVLIESGHPTFASIRKVIEEDAYSYFVAMGLLEE